MRRFVSWMVGLLVALPPISAVTAAAHASDPGTASGSATLNSIVVEGNVVRFTWTPQNLEPEGGEFAAAFRGCKDDNGLDTWIYPAPASTGNTKTYTVYADLLGPDFLVDLSFRSYWKNPRGELHPASEYSGRFAEFQCGVEYTDSWTIEGEDIPEAVINTAVPTVTGTPQVGVKLTASPGSWSPSDGSYAYQWLADDVALDGETGSTFTPTADVEGKQIRVQVKASKSGYSSGTATSVPTAAVAASAANRPSFQLGGYKVSGGMGMPDQAWFKYGAFSLDPKVTTTITYTVKGCGGKVAGRMTTKTSGTKFKTINVKVKPHNVGRRPKFYATYTTPEQEPVTVRVPTSQTVKDGLVKHRTTFKCR